MLPPPPVVLPNPHPITTIHFRYSNPQSSPLKLRPSGHIQYMQVVRKSPERNFKLEQKVLRPLTRRPTPSKRKKIFTPHHRRWWSHHSSAEQSHIILEPSHKPKPEISQTRSSHFVSPAQTCLKFSKRKPIFVGQHTSRPQSSSPGCFRGQSSSHPNIRPYSVQPLSPTRAIKSNPKPSLGIQGTEHQDDIIERAYPQSADIDQTMVNIDMPLPSQGSEMSQVQEQWHRDDDTIIDSCVKVRDHHNQEHEDLQVTRRTGRINQESPKVMGTQRSEKLEQLPNKLVQLLHNTDIGPQDRVVFPQNKSVYWPLGLVMLGVVILVIQILS